MNEQTLFRALEAYGRSQQALQTVEECAELQTSIMHWLKNRTGAKESVIEEIADVTIMVAQMRLAFGPAAVDAVVDAKLARLQKRIEGMA